MTRLAFTFEYSGQFTVVAQTVDIATEQAANDLPPDATLTLIDTAPHDPAGGDGPDD